MVDGQVSPCVSDLVFQPWTAFLGFGEWLGHRVHRVRESSDRDAQAAFEEEKQKAPGLETAAVKKWVMVTSC